MHNISRSKQLVSIVVFTLVLIAMLFLVLCDSSQTGIAAPKEVNSNSKAETLLSTTELTPQLYLPSIFRSYATPAYRLGYCSTNGSIDQYPPIGQLRAGWYVNFSTSVNPPRPQNMEYVRTIRLHQLTTCLRDNGDYLRDRAACPYVQINGNYTYTLVSPNTRADIVSLAQANPGTLWLIGNEMDRYDCGGVNPYNPSLVGDPETCHQDEMLPELYAQAYHEFYHLLKGADPTAQVAIGGIIQATPSRLEYLTKAWNEYNTRYGTNMPVDVWNVHNFIFKEKCDDWGADIPPGCTDAVCTRIDGDGPICYGATYSDNKHHDLGVFNKQIRAFRQWMKDRGQQNKPLIVSEYGIIYFHVPGIEDPDVVGGFMLATFDYFMNAKDCSLGYPADECRLVQRWAWYSLDNNVNVNQYSYLIDPDTSQMTLLGEAFANYAQNHLEAP